MNYPDKERAFLSAKRRVEKLRAFYSHLGVYIVVNCLISAIRIVINLRNGESFADTFFDFSFSANWLFWGVALTMHAFAVFVLPLILGNNWEEEKIKQYMEEDKHNNFN
ncbi:2TM domain-containing protein [Pontimicrobium sp. SW4]|uniref:2TM domain-containing protein n=1 Tax=Pontimicrobium sp. SW4 TaxID=3153519 RepID=A0AAU7BVR0_9FLAO